MDAFEGVSSVQACSNQPLDKEIDFQKLERNMSVASTNITGILEGDMIEGIHSSKGGLMRMWFVDDKKALKLPYGYAMVPGEGKPRVGGKRFFSPCRPMVKHFLEYFHGDRYLCATKHAKRKAWKGPEDRRVQMEQFEGKVHGKHLPATGKLKFLCDLGDNLPNHRDVGGNDLRFRMQVYRLPDAMVKDIFDFFGDVGTEVVDAIQNKPWPFWHVHDLVRLHTRIKGTKDGSSTSVRADGRKNPVMTFRRGTFKVVRTAIDDSQPADLVLEEGAGSHVYILKKHETVLRVRACTSTRKTPSFIEFCPIPCTQEAVDALEACDRRPMMKTGVYKSLLQKIVRFQPQVVRVRGTDVDARVALLYCVYKVVFGPAQYLPALHRSVQGPENVAKRLAVIAFEDSDPTVVEDELPGLLGAALLSQLEPTWFPSTPFIASWCKVALALLEAKRAVEYETYTSYPVAEWSARSPFAACAFLLRRIGSFEGDMRMVEYQAKHRDHLRFVSVSTRPSTMPYPDHGLDQHVKPSMVYLLPDECDYSPSRTAFGGRTKFMFEKVTGVNPRRHRVDSMFEELQAVKAVRAAQCQYQRLWAPPALRPRSDNVVHHVFVLSDEVLAGGIGAWSIGTFKGVPMSASLDPFDVRRIVCTPTAKQRGVKVDQIQHAFDRNVQEKAHVAAETILKKGNLRFDKINAGNLPIRVHGWLVRRGDDGFSLRPSATAAWVPWDELKRWEKAYPVTTALPVEGLDRPYDGMASMDSIEAHCATVEPRTLQRALTYLNHFNPGFKMAVVGRDGGTALGSEPVDQRDSHVFKLFLQLSRLAPYALRPALPFEFKVENPWLLQQVRGVMEKVLRRPASSAWTGYALYDREGRDLFDFQEESISRLMAEFRSNRRRHFMRLPVGMGKTLITLTYLARRGLEDVDFIVYTMPRSAFHSVLGEMVSMGFRVAVYTNYQRSKAKAAVDDAYRSIGEGTTWDWTDTRLRPTVHNFPKKGQPMPPFYKGTIIVVEHDGLQKYKEALLRIIGQSVFVIDEVHKCLLHSLRSGAALTLSRVARETVAFTGTPILNKNGATLLIRWLEGNVRFRVTEKNFVVATNAMISYSPPPRVKEEVIEMPFNLTEAEQREYNEFQEDKDLQQMVRVCHRATLRKMVEVVEGYRIAGEKVFLVAKNAQAQTELAVRLRGVLPRSDRIACLKMGTTPLPTDVDAVDSIDLTDQKVQEGKVVDYDVVITRERYNAGYNLTRMAVMVSGVYFGNEADREQVRGRIHRLSQNNPVVRYVYVHTGVLSAIRQDYGLVAVAAKCIQQQTIGDADMDRLLNTSRKRRRKA